MRSFLLFFFMIFQVHADDFPVRGSMRIRVNFWKKVYTQITTSEAFIHDEQDLTIIYKKVDLPHGRRARRKFHQSEKKKLRQIIHSIASKKYQNLTPQEQQIADILGKRSKDDLYQKAKNLRFQYGLKDRYFRGLISSYEYLDYIKKIFRDNGLPEQLSYLPHVESSFNYKAYSKVGAAGIWQFMRGTARRYGLKVKYVVDERRDVIKATHAAVKFLKDNYRMLGTWPLALTAYNHGPRSIMQAVKKVNSKEIEVIVEKYNGRRFRFASKNFYATYMATVEISEEPEKYFPGFKKPEPFKFSELTLKKRMTVKQIIKVLGISQKVIKKYNLSIRPVGFRSNLYLPRNFQLHLPKMNRKKLVEKERLLAAFKPPKKKYELEQVHIVSRGENLSDIANLYRKKLNSLVEFNNISNPSRIFAGMKINIPGKDSKKIKRKNKKLIAKHLVENKSTMTAKVYKLKPGDIYGPILVPMDLEFTNKENLESYNLDINVIQNDLYSISVEVDETLGHFADWAGIVTQSIRDANGFKDSSNILYGQKLKIRMTPKQLEKFKRARIEYHLMLQEDFFKNYRVTSSHYHMVKKGENLTEILQEKEVPFWLVRQAQPQGRLKAGIYVGQKLVIPEVESLN